jgi:hypothetical protein
MGITGLLTFLNSAKKNNKDIIDLRGKVVIIDLLYVLHQKIIGKKKHNSQTFNNDGDNITHFHILLRYMTGLLEREIRPIVIVDTKAPVEKTITIENRKQQTVKIEDSDEIEEKQTIIDYKTIKKCIEFLKNLGITVIISDGEADPDCAMLANRYKNIIAGIVSNDSDMLLYNAPSMINISFGTKLDNYVSYSEYNIDDVMKYLFKLSYDYRYEYKLKYKPFTQEDFINFSIMLGTDYHIDNIIDDTINITNKDNKNINTLEKIEKLFKLFTLNDYSVENTIEYITKYNKEEFIKPHAELDVYNYHVHEDYLNIWKKIKNIYCNPKITYVDNYMIDDYGHMNVQKIKDSLGNIDEEYKEYIINSLIKIKKGHMLFKSMGKINDEFSSSFRSYRLKYGQKQFRIEEDNGFYESTKSNFKKIFDMDKYEKICKPSNDWTFVNNNNRKIKKYN